MAGYTRQDASNNIANGNVIDADDLNKEFNAVAAAFDTATGHSHSGAAGDGGPISVTGPAQEYVSTSTSLSPKGNNLYDLGATGQQWKDVYVAGTANLAGVDISGGSIDDTVIGATTPAAGNFTSVLTTGNLTVGGTFTVDEVSLVTGTMDSAVITTADINGGTIDGTVIGATTPAAGTFTTATATDLTVNGDITVTGTIDGVDVALLKSDFDTLEASVEDNQDAFSTFAVETSGGTVNILADQPQDTVVFDAGTGISLSADPVTDTVTIINSAPDQTVEFTNGVGIAVTGDYPSFTVTNTAPDQTVVINAGTGLAVDPSSSYPVFNLTNTAPNVDVNIVGGVGITVDDSNYPNVSISSTISEGDTYFADGTSIVLNPSTNVFSHADTSSQPTVSNGGDTVIQSIQLDEYGHVINLASKTLSIPSATPPANDATITISVSNGLSGGGNFTTDQSGNEIISVQGVSLSSSLWAAGTSNTEAVISPAKLAAAAGGVGSGGQTWQEPTRAFDTVYQNTTGKAIMVALSAAIDQPFAEVSTDNSTWVGIWLTSNNQQNTASFIVPDGHYYRAGTAGSNTLYSWRELR